MKIKHGLCILPLLCLSALAVAEQSVRNWREEVRSWRDDHNVLHISNVGIATRPVKPLEVQRPQASADLPEPPSAAAPLTPALNVLLERALQELQDNELERAFFSLERALRIAQDNGLIWHYMARVRWQQGDYRQAETLAQRSNRARGADPILRRHNDSLIATAHVLLQANNRLVASGTN